MTHVLMVIRVRVTLFSGLLRWPGGRKRGSGRKHRRRCETLCCIWDLCQAAIEWEPAAQRGPKNVTRKTRSVPALLPSTPPEGAVQFRPWFMNLTPVQDWPARVKDYWAHSPAKLSQERPPPPPGDLRPCRRPEGHKSVVLVALWFATMGREEWNESLELCLLVSITWGGGWHVYKAGFGSAGQGWRAENTHRFAGKRDNGAF